MNLSNIPKEIDKATSGFNFLKVWRYPAALAKGVKKAKESSERWPHKRISVFWDSFKSAMAGVEDEANAVTGETEAAAVKSYEEMLGDVKSEIDVDDKLEGEDKEFFDETLATAVRSFKEGSAEIKGLALSGVKKIKDSEKKDEEADLDDEEKTAVASVASLTLKNLKAQYPKAADFTKALKRLQKLSDKTKFPALAILQSSLLGVFKIRNKNDGKKFVTSMGISDSIGDYIGVGDASDAGELLSGIAKDPIENKDGIVKFFKAHIFKATSDSKVALVIEKLNKLIVSKARTMSTDQFVEFVNYIDPADYDHMAEIFAGKRGAKA